jgi:uncharacterized membrane protein HdeD (DUF308 family)
MCAYSDPTHRPDASREDAIRESMALAMGLLLILLGAIAIILPMVATLVVMWLLGWVLVFAAVAQFVEAILTRGENGTISRVLRAVLYAVFGGMLLLRPVTAAIAATAIIATLFIVDGIIELGLAFRLRGSTTGRGWLMSGGILSIVLGVMIWRGFTLSAIWAIGLFVGVRVVFKGIEVMMRHHYPKNRLDRAGDWGKRAA